MFRRSDKRRFALDSLFLKKRIDNAQTADIIQKTIEHLIKSEGGTGP